MAASSRFRVPSSLRLAFALGIGLWLPASAFAKEPGDYRLGDTIEEDIIAPVPLIVVDAAATETLKQKEISRVPVIFRFQTTAAEQAERDLHTVFSNTRSNFLRWVENRFRVRELSEADLASERYAQLVEEFGRQGKGFPLSDELAALWAKGNSGRTIEAAVSVQLLDASDHLIRVDNLPAEFKPGSSIRLLRVTDTNEVIALEDIEIRGKLISKTNLITLSRARLDLQARFSPEEKSVARLAASLLRVNCFVDEALNRQARAPRVDPVYAADNYAAGQTIARRGEVVNRKILDALAQLRERTVVGRLQQQVSVEKSRATEISRRNQWLAVTLAVVVAVLAAIAWMLARRRPGGSLLPVRVSGELGSVGTETGTWQQRAIAAEQRADRAHQAIRSGVFKQLAHAFGRKLLRGLISQRTELMDAQQSAAVEMAEMERRLDELHTPLQERLSAYELRIVELEKALAAKGEENRELIKAKILLIRRQLEAERERNRMELN